MGWKIVVASIAVCTSAFSQDVEIGMREGLFQVSGSIYPTFNLTNGAVQNVVGGHFAYQFDQDYSFRGDIFVYTSTQSGTPDYNDFTLVEAGFLRNFTHKRWDLFLGLELGLAGVQLAPSGLNEPQNSPAPARYYQPSVDGLLGFKFHVSPYFYFYGETHTIIQRHPEMNESLSNFAVSGGLGLQLPTQTIRNRTVIEDYGR